MSSGTPDPDAIARLLRRGMKDGPLTIKVVGSSMVGVIDSGSEVLVSPAEEARIGEIWAFVDDGGAVVVHRVREVGRGLVVGRGTGNIYDDDPVAVDRLIGRVGHAIEPRGRSRRFGRLDRVTAAAAFRIRRYFRRLRT